MICPYSHGVKMLLWAEGVEYGEIDVMMSTRQRRKMRARSGSGSVPQIFVDGTYIGDCSCLYDLDAEGDLDVKIGLNG